MLRTGAALAALIVIATALVVLDRTVFAPSNDPVGLVQALLVEVDEGTAAPVSDEQQLGRDMGDRVRVRFLIEEGDSATVSLFVDDVAVVQDLLVEWTAEEADLAADRGFVELTATPFRFGSKLRLAATSCQSSRDPNRCLVVAQLESDL